MELMEKESTMEHLKALNDLIEFRNVWGTATDEVDMLNSDKIRDIPTIDKLGFQNMDWEGLLQVMKTVERLLEGEIKSYNLTKEF